MGCLRQRGLALLHTMVPAVSWVTFIWKKLAFAPFKKKNPVFCPTFQTNLGNAPLLKLDFNKIELSDFEKIEFQNMGISLISLESGAKCWIVFMKGAKANFFL